MSEPQSKSASASFSSVFFSVNNLVGLVSAIIAAIGAGLTAYYAWDTHFSQKALDTANAQMNRTKNEIEAKAAQIQGQIGLIHSQIEQTQEDRQRIMNVYKEVIDAIHDSNPERRELAAGLIVFYLRPQSSGATPAEDQFRQEMLDKLAAHATTQAEHVAVAEAKFNLQDQSPTLSDAPPPRTATPGTKTDDLQGYRVDVFWCESSPPGTATAATQLSEKIAAHTIGTVRARLLPATVNASAGYGVHGLLIRHEPQEVGVATRLRDIAAQNLVGVGLAGSPLIVQQIVYRTPGYVSLFLCPAS